VRPSLLLVTESFVSDYSSQLEKRLSIGFQPFNGTRVKPRKPPAKYGSGVSIVFSSNSTIMSLRSCVVCRHDDHPWIWWLFTWTRKSGSVCDQCCKLCWCFSLACPRTDVAFDTIPEGVTVTVCCIYWLFVRKLTRNVTQRCSPTCRGSDVHKTSTRMRIQLTAHVTVNTVELGCNVMKATEYFVSSL
jgi:hypothetical protein